MVNKQRIWYVCKSCGEWFPENHDSCPDCGSELRKTCAECGAPIGECECD